MHLNTKPLKVALIASTTALILTGFYTFFDQDASQGQTTSSTQPNKAPMAGTDPFKEHLDKQQKGSPIQSSPAQPSQSIQIVIGNSTSTVPIGTDPFKAFLDAQSKAKSEEAAISPFTK